MQDILVIVESPQKGKKISQILGSGYTVKASTGHVCDLPDDRLGIDIDDACQESYVPTKSETLADLRRAARRARAVILATDPDREGEAIAWHLARLVPGSKPVSRVTFNQITPDAIQQAFANPGSIDQMLVNAQRARRVIDRLIGYLLSPFLSQTDPNGQALSAGRVQSAALRIIVDRERERRAFTSHSLWVIDAYLLHQGQPLQARLMAPKPITDQHVVDAILDQLSQATTWWVETVMVTDDQRHPPPPFTTSTLQQEASRCLQYEPHQTDQAAQALYEAGAITYPRSDSVHVAPEAQQAARTIIHCHYGPGYLPEQPPSYPAKRGTQGAHECIRPTHPSRPLADDAQTHLDLYTLIWQRFIASQMAPARFQVTCVTVRSGADQDTPLPHTFTARSQQPVFLGYRALYDEMPDIDEAREQEENDLPQTDLPPLADGITLQLDRLTAPRKQTRPPHRYTSARLIAALDRQRIGRPSTFGTISQTLRERGYLSIQHHYLVPTPLGENILDTLLEHFPDIFDLAFTATIEALLDHIARGQASYKDVVGAFYYGTLQPALHTAYQAVQHSSQPAHVCPLCGRLLLRHSGKRGPFWGCSGYPDACTYTESLTSLPLKEIVS
ncbi:MAG: type I DNA topoisomerase [Anaerolineae bacterium]|nr:type I DNA topoisomerase [Anaerolineae bacterium]